MLLVAACDSTTAPFQLDEDEARTIVTSAEALHFQELLQGLKSGIDSADNPTALLAMTETELGNPLFSDPDGMTKWTREFESAKSDLYAAFPVMSRMSGEAPECLMGAEQFAAYTASLEGRDGIAFSDELPEDEDGPVCGSYFQQVKLLACAALCSTMGPAAGLCGWACWCMLCSENSAVYDFMCDPF